MRYWSVGEWLIYGAMALVVGLICYGGWCMATVESRLRCLGDTQAHIWVHEFGPNRPWFITRFSQPVETGDGPCPGVRP